MLSKRIIESNRQSWSHHGTNLIRSYTPPWGMHLQPLDLSNISAVQGTVLFLAKDGFDLMVLGYTDLAHDVLTRCIELGRHMLKNGEYQPIYDRMVVETTEQILYEERTTGESMVSHCVEAASWLLTGERDLTLARRGTVLWRDVYEFNTRKLGVDSLRRMLLLYVQCGLYEEAVSLYKSDWSCFVDVSKMASPLTKLARRKKVSPEAEATALYEIANYALSDRADVSSISDEIGNWCDHYRDWKWMAIPLWNERLSWAWIRSALITGETDVASTLEYVRGY
jgi:hypothetical protein